MLVDAALQQAGDVFAVVGDGELGQVPGGWGSVDNRNDQGDLEGVVMSGDTLAAEEQAMFRALEEELWREESRFDRNRIEELIAPNFFEFGGSGNIHDRRATLAVARAPIRATLPLPDFEARRLAEDVVQVNYNSIVENDGVVQHRRRSSIWTRTATGWVIRFHQGTPFAS